MPLSPFINILFYSPTFPVYVMPDSVHIGYVTSFVEPFVGVILQDLLRGQRSHAREGTLYNSSLFTFVTRRFL